MKVVQIIPCFWFGGAETMCENLCYELVNQGVDVVVISLYGDRTDISKRMEANGISIKYLDKVKGVDLSMIPKICRILKKEAPDVVHIHLSSMLYAVPAAILAGVKKRVQTIHSIAVRSSYLLYRVASKFYYKACKTLPVALSEGVRDAISDEYGIRKEKIPVVFNGVDINKCLPKSDYKLGEVFSIVHVGRFSEAKNHIVMLSAFKLFNEKVPNSKLILVGDGELREEIEFYISKNNMTNCVELVGKQSNVFKYLSNADIFTLPSKWEGVPLSLIEAMGTGLPIVATKVGGIPEMVVDGESALLVENNEYKIADAFLKLFEDEALRETIGKNARSTSYSFSSEEMAKHYIEIYKS